MNGAELLPDHGYPVRLKRPAGQAPAGADCSRVDRRVGPQRSSHARLLRSSGPLGSGPCVGRPLHAGGSSRIALARPAAARHSPRPRRCSSGQVALPHHPQRAGEPGTTSGLLLDRMGSSGMRVACTAVAVPACAVSPSNQVHANRLHGMLPLAPPAGSLAAAGLPAAAPECGGPRRRRKRARMGQHAQRAGHAGAGGPARASWLRPLHRRHRRGHIVSLFGVLWRQWPTPCWPGLPACHKQECVVASCCGPNM